MSTLRVADLRFGYGSGREVIHVPELRIESGERVFLHGPSGSGKTTLLGLLAGVLPPRAGAVVHAGQHDFAKMSSAARDAYRGAHLGYIFQLFNLIPYLSVRQNIELPLRLHADRRARARATVEQLAEHLGIANELDANATEISVGQQQRVAAARALIGAPQFVIADEPTSSLDTDHRARFLELLFREVKEAGSTLLFVSHDRSLAPLFDRALSLPELNRVS